jgi:hypothetical protein
MAPLLWSFLIVEVFSLFMMGYFIGGPGFSGLIALYISFGMIPFSIASVVQASFLMSNRRLRGLALTTIIISVIVGFPVTSLLLATGIAPVIKPFVSAFEQREDPRVSAQIEQRLRLERDPEKSLISIARIKGPHSSDGSFTVGEPDLVERWPLLKMFEPLFNLPGYWQKMFPRVIVNPASLRGGGRGGRDVPGPSQGF